MLDDYFHATTDKQAVRDRVYATILRHDFQIQATVCEKSKAQPQVRRDKATFYKYPWYYHFKHGATRQLRRDDKLLVTAASLGSKKERATFTKALEDVVAQTMRRDSCAVDFRPAQTCFNLQVADYCAWAIQRKWERGDRRSYDPLADRITYEYDLWSRGTTHYF